MIGNRKPTLIERLDVKHPGLENDVCVWLKSYVTEVEVAARLRAKYHETVTPKTIDNYKQKRLRVEAKRIYEQKIAYQAFMQAVGEEGLDAGAAAQLWEALQRMQPKELIALRRVQVERARVDVLSRRADVEAQRAENEKKELQATLQQLKKPRGGGKGAVEGAASHDSACPEELRRRINEIYGIYDDNSKGDSQPAPNSSGTTPREPGAPPAAPGDVGS